MDGSIRMTGGRWPKWLLAASGGFALIAGCKHVDPEVAAPPVARLGGGSTDQLEAGRAIYLGESKCARCHNPRTVVDYPADEWTARILPRMAKKAKLTQQEYGDVQAYILATAGSQSPR